VYQGNATPVQWIPWPGRPREPTRKMPVSEVTNSLRARFIHIGGDSTGIAEGSTGASKQATTRATYDRAVRRGAAGPF
jgi:hypothetical protein